MPGVLYAFASYLALAVVVTFPLVLSFDRSVSDPVDPILNSWVLAWEHHALLRFPGDILNANIFYPHRNTLLYSETLFVPSLFLLPVTLAFDSVIASHNLLVLSGFASTATSGYLLGRWLFRNQASALVLGGVLAFNAYTVSNIGQAQLLHLEWLPLALLYLGKLHRRPTLRNAMFVAIFLAAQFYTAVYYGIFSFVILALVGGTVWLFFPFSRWQVHLSALGWLFASLLVAVGLCLPLALPYYRISQRYAFERTLTDAWPFSASLEMWLSAPANHLLYGGMMRGELPKLGFYVVDSLFPGFVVILSAGVGLLLWFARSSPLNPRRSERHKYSFWWPLALLLAILLFFLLSLGPFPQKQTLQPDLEIRLPYAWLHETIPGFQALRAPGRFAIVVMLGLALCSAYLVRQIQSTIARSLLLLALLVEIGALAPHTLYFPTANAEQDAAYQWLAKQPRSAYLELPLYPFGRKGDETRWLESQFQSTKHWHASPVGYSGFFPPRYYELQDYLNVFPQDDVVHFLQVTGVEWLILHRDRIADEQWQRIQDVIKVRRWKGERWGDIWVVQLPRLPQTPPRMHYIVPDVARRGESLALGIVLTSDTSTPIVPDSAAAQVRIEWMIGERKMLDMVRVFQPPFYVDALASANVSIPVPDRIGNYTLRIYDVVDSALLESATVRVVDDVASPERQLLPVRALAAEVSCGEEGQRLDITMQTIGWYDNAFTLSARFVDDQGQEAARSEADVEFWPEHSRGDLLSRHRYTLPLELPQAFEPETVSVELVAYQWQQIAERVVGRRFVLEDGTVADTIRLPIEKFAVCE